MKKIIFVATVIATNSINAMDNGSSYPFRSQALGNAEGNSKESHKEILCQQYQNADMNLFYSPFEQQTTALIVFRKEVGQDGKGKRIMQIVNPAEKNFNKMLIAEICNINGYDETTFKALFNENMQRCKTQGYRHSKITT